MTTSPLTEQQLADIETRAVHFVEYGGIPLDLEPVVCEDVPALLAEVRRLQAALAHEERLHGDTIDDRDRAQDAADKLAYAVASEDVIGEHTADNSPWANALDLITSKAEVDKLRRDRDLAIAHDRQPYPTAWAYEQACKAREAHRERADAAEAVIADMRAKHKPRTERHGSGCVQCGTVWPCATYRALPAAPAV